MRRSLVLVVALLAAFLVAFTAVAAGAAREIERDVAFTLESEGFEIQVLVLNNDGDVDATLTVSRGALAAYYSVPAEVTAERVTARFGRLGELDYRFAPKLNGRVDCDSAEEGEAVFEGTFVFAGENRYVHIEASQAEGSFRIYPAPKNCSQRQLARRVVPYHPTYSGEGATLEARAGSRAKQRGREVNVFDLGEKGSDKVIVDAFLGERREGMSVARGVRLAAGAGAFRWNFRRGTATLRPPAPFTGWATFTRRGNGRPGVWKGPLEMPILGGDPVKIAGSEFRAAIHKGLPQAR